MKTQEQYNELMEKVFNEPYPNIEMIKQSYIEDLVNMELECDYPKDISNERVGTTIKKIKKYFNNCSDEEIKILWEETFNNC